MTVTAEMAMRAARNAQQPYRTPCARVRDALQHVRMSQTRQSPLAAGFINHRADESQGRRHEA